MLHTITANLILLEANQSQESPLNLINLISQGSWIVMGVLALLLIFSLVCWFIIAYKYIYLWLAKKESEEFLELFWQSKKLDAIYQSSENLARSPIAQVFRAGYIELSKVKGQREVSGQEMSAHLGDIENVERALRRATQSEITHLESMVPFLATTGSTAPFIGLFGTVWGIMESFDKIGQMGAASFTVVAPGIAHALIATAVGLFAAIPAVIAYNYFVRKTRVLSADMEAFSNDFLNIVRRHFF